MSIVAKNTVIKIGDGEVSEAFVQILGVTQISLDGRSWDTEETTNHDNDVPVRTGQPTVYTNGNISLVITWNGADTQHAALKALSETGEANNFQLIHVDDAEGVEFEGFVTGFQFDPPVDGLLKANVTVMVNGAFAEIV